MVNNFDIIKEKLTFLNNKSFYFIQILKRKKENPELSSYSVPVESFYIFDIKKYERIMPRIIEICEKNKARAYIKMNCLDALSVMLEQISIITQEIRKQNWDSLSFSLNSACGKCGKQDDNEKLYLVDLDNVTIGDNKYNEIITFINEAEPTTVTNKIYLSVPTKHGCHLLTTGFDIQKFKSIYPKIDIHSDGNVLLYFPESCD